MTLPPDRKTDRRANQPLAIDWPTVLAKHDRWLRTIVYWRLREGEAVDEVMQEVALAAVRQAAPLADASKVGPWLYRLAVRQVLLYRRRRGRQRKLLERYEARCYPGRAQSEGVDPLNWLLSDERQQLVRAAIERLPGRDAEILLLKYTEQWSYQQIADHLGIGHSAVESRLHRARARLRTELAASQLVEVRR
jgi:RNA polymerase sigma-70 factor (ECF subfamily)